MIEPTPIRFHFEGGIAGEGKLDFYEASRFQYGAARLIYTLHTLRTKGTVPQRITQSSVDLSFIVGTPKQGSWEILIFEAAKAAAATLASAPISALISYTLHLLFPPTLQAKQFNSEDVKKIIEAENPSLKQALDIIKDGQRNDHQTIQRLIGLIEEAKNHEMNVDVPNFEERLMSLEGSVKRLTHIEPHIDQLSKLTSDSDVKTSLIQRARPQVREIGYPLHKSAHSLTIHANDNDSDLKNTLHLSDISALNADFFDDRLENIVGILKRFDKETGWGQIRTRDGLVSFLVRRERKASQVREILDAMSGDVVSILANAVKDEGGTLKYYVFARYLGEID